MPLDEEDTSVAAWPCLRAEDMNTSPTTELQARNELVERITRAMARVAGYYRPITRRGKGVSEQPAPAPEIERLLRDYARAALTVILDELREPSDAMLNAGGDWYVDQPQIHARQKWCAMLATLIHGE